MKKTNFQEWAFWVTLFNQVGLDSNSFNWFDPVTNKHGDIGECFMPGRLSFLGGSGMSITSMSHYKDQLWDFMQIMTSNNYSIGINGLLDVMPPYTPAISASPLWTTPDYRIKKANYDKAVPIQYPQSSFPQFNELEQLKPARYLLLEMMYKNLTDDQLSDRFCQLIDYVMLPECTPSHFMVEDNGCTDDMSRLFTYRYDSKTPCRGGTPLYDSVKVTCDYIPYNSKLSIAMTVSASLCLFGLVILMGFMFYYRHTRQVKSTSYMFSQILLVGCLLVTVSTFFSSGNPKDKICGLDNLLVGIGYILIVAPLLLKMRRLVILFTGISNLSDSNLTDNVLLVMLGGILGIQVILMILWQFIDRPMAHSFPRVFENLSYSESICSSVSTTYGTATLLFDMMLLLYMLGLAFQARKVPCEYNESKLMGIVAFIVTFLLLILIPSLYFISDVRSTYIIRNGGLLFSVICVSCISSVPKIRAAAKKKEPKRHYKMAPPPPPREPCERCGHVNTGKKDEITSIPPTIKDTGSMTASLVSSFW